MASAFFVEKLSDKNILEYQAVILALFKNNIKGWKDFFRPK